VTLLRVLLPDRRVGRRPGQRLAVVRPQRPELERLADEDRLPVERV
jgi:hypothetical protein